MVDYAGWQLIDAYMQDYVRLRPDMEDEKEGFVLFQETYNAQNYSMQKPPNSEAIRLYLISHSWRNAGINLYAAFVNNKAAYQNDWSDAQATEFLQDKITAISPEALGAQRNADYKALAAAKERLKMEIAQNFMGSAPVSEAALATTAEPAMTESDDDTMSLSEDTATFTSEAATEDTAEPRGFTLPVAAEESSTNGINLLNYAINPISLGAAALLLLLLLYLFGLYKRLDNRVDKHSKRIEDLTTRLFLKKDPISADDINDLKEQVATLQRELEQLKKPSTPPPTPAPASKPPKRRSLIAEQDEYYLSTPNSDGTFNESSMSNQFRPSASVYKFLITKANGSQQAEFTVANDYDAVKDALSSPGSYLDPVCESINPYFPGAKRIVNIRPGQAVKQGDKWVVKPEHKARIRYE